MTTTIRAIRGFAFTLLFLTFAASAQNSADLLAKSVHFSIAPQPLASALLDFSSQSGVNVSTAEAQISKVRTKGVNGTRPVGEALQLLLEGTGLQFGAVGANTIAIRKEGVPSREAAADSIPTEMQAREHALQIAQATSPEKLAQSAENQTVDPAKSAGNQPKDSNDEVTVTGTLIRGVRSASPVITVDRDYIEKSGYFTLFQVLQTLPQNFSGGDTEGSVGSLAGSGRNPGYGSGMNLRGLGGKATLTLINGHRLPPTAYGQFTDISLIPVSAVERVDVLADGASATYGSDAVGGVVNVILRKDYAGAATELSVGDVTDGNLRTYHASQLFGMNWATGNLLLNYDFSDRDALLAEDRSFSANLPKPIDLTPSQQTHGLLARVQQRLSDTVSLDIGAIASKRNALNQVLNLSFGPNALYTDDAENRLIAAMTHASVDLPGEWRADFTGDYSRTEMEDHVTITGIFNGYQRSHFDIASLGAQTDGPLLQLPGGALRLAVGGQWRNEKYKTDPGGVLASNASNDVTAAFAELFVPVVGAGNARTGIKRLELTVAGRYEDYGDFGQSTDPKIGLLWAPTDATSLRTTYGTSFRAPTFYELGSPMRSSLNDYPDPTATTPTVPVLVWSGGNPTLSSENATTWTAGMDFSPPGANFDTSLTYFDTKFEDRIVTPLSAGSEILGVLFSPADRIYSSLITRNPSAALVNAIVASSAFADRSPTYSLADTAVVLDVRSHNFASENVRGLDGSANYRLPTAAGDWQFRIAGTYFLEFKDVVAPGVPVNDLLNTTYHQLRFKTRGQTSWAYDAWNAVATVNYVSGSTNKTAVPSVDVSSWTTFDAQVSYTADGLGGWFKGSRIALNLLNIFDRDPPFVTSPLASRNIGYDPANANPLGRSISVTFSKEWRHQ